MFVFQGDDLSKRRIFIAVDYKIYTAFYTFEIHSKTYFVKEM